MDTVSNRLRWLREQAGYESAAAFAREHGIPESTYYGHENGSRGIRQGEIKQYAKCFNVSIEWLLTGDGYPGRQLVRIVGHTSKRGRVILKAATKRDEEEFAPNPPKTEPDTVAILIKPSSGIRCPSPAGVFVYFSNRRASPAAGILGHLCVVGLANGDILLRWIFAGRRPGHYDLEGEVVETLRDIPVTWASKVTALVPA